jgi:polyisoprenoid-binding protein YceI
MSDSEPGAIRFVVNTSRSRFQVQAFATGILSSFGHSPKIAIRDFQGEVHFVPGKPEASSVRIVAQMDSLRVTDDVSEKDRSEIERTMRNDVLEISRFPEAIFESTEVSGSLVFEGQYRVTMNGNLTLHGVNTKQSLQAQVIVSENQLRAQGDFPLRQTDYHMKLVSVAGGTLKLKDELKFTFEIILSPAPGSSK